jgi:uncharacterized membrane protein YeaQ/YmgE (transglycosylase-associated protein family)
MQSTAMEWTARRLLGWVGALVMVGIGSAAAAPGIDVATLLVIALVVAMGGATCVLAERYRPS